MVKLCRGLSFRKESATVQSPSLACVLVSRMTPITFPLMLPFEILKQSRHLVRQWLDTYFFREELHRLTPDLPVYWENWHAAGAMYSTAEDLLRFSNELFGGRLLNTQSLQEMFHSGAGEYGFGTWVYNDYEIAAKRYTVVKRPGRIMGAQSVLFHVLGTDSTVIILSNTSRTSMDDFAAAIASRLRPRAVSH